MELLLPSPKGMAKATRTPVMVACTPECSISHHITTPSTR